jgi:FkbM family methyltransferase
MKRPFLLSITPERWRLSVWSRFYRNRQSDWLPLYKSASLHFAPQIDMELVPGDVLSDRVAFMGVHETDLSRRVVELGRKGGTMVDIGANLGYFTLLWAACNPANKCIAFEASPRNVEILRRNVSRNGLESQIEIVPCAAGAAPGKFQFDLGPPDQRGWGGLALAASDRSIEVDVVRADEAIPSNTQIALMKVDTEGADAWALMGCERLLKAGAVREIWFEQNKPRSQALGIPLDAAREFLRTVGYAATPRGEQGSQVVEWVAVRA